MTETGIVLLSSARPGLSAALAERLPGLRVAALDPATVPADADGRLWCFIDWLLAETSGLEMCRRLRAMPVTSQAHITMVLDDDDSEARRRALRAGADDYLIGPLTADMLVERLAFYSKAPQRTPAAAQPSLGELRIDLAAQTARWRGRPLVLRPVELRLLCHFVENPDEVFSRAALIARLGKDGEGVDERTVDVWIGRLRRALTAQGVPDHLRTVRSMGYVLDSDGFTTVSRI